MKKVKESKIGDIEAAIREKESGNNNGRLETN